MTAMIGTTVGVIIAGLIAMIVGSAAHLTGFGTEEATMLFYIPKKSSSILTGFCFLE